MLMTFLPIRLTTDSFMRWLGLTRRGGLDVSPIVDVMSLGQKYFRMPPETLRANASAFTGLSDDDLRALRMPVLLLVGAGEVLYDAPAALTRARRLIPDFEGELIPDCRHDMCFSQRAIVDARVLDFLRRKGANDRSKGTRVA